MAHGLKKALDHFRQNGLSDAQLLKLFISERDESAFAALVRRHGRMVLGVCRRILRDSHDTDDAFQATFLVLVRKATSVLNREAIGTWLYTVAYRCALEAKARITRRQKKEIQMKELPQPEVAPPECRDWQPILDRELHGLPEKYRAPIILCDLEGKPRREAARQLRLAEGTLSSRLATARRMLAQKLARHGVTLSGGALAMSLSEASGGVPPSLVATTTKGALLVAAGQMAALSISISEILKGATQAMFVAKMKATLRTVMALVLGAGTLVYCASGQTSSASKPQTELEALRHENELLKINLRVTLEKIKTLEGEVVALKARTNANAVVQVDVSKLASGWEKLYLGDLKVNVDFEKALKIRPDEMEAALKLLRAAKDAESRRKAVDQMEQVMKRLREEVRPQAEKQKVGR
jgi:RNA polymerase sigma factor (sigma-70 family)